jgi:hypothetical protein
MNLIEGGRPRIGCIRRQPSAGSLILSLEKGHPSMGKIAGPGSTAASPGTGVQVAATPRRSDWRAGGIEP